MSRDKNTHICGAKYVRAGRFSRSRRAAENGIRTALRLLGASLATAYLADESRHAPEGGGLSSAKRPALLRLIAT